MVPPRQAKDLVLATMDARQKELGGIAWPELAARAGVSERTIHAARRSEYPVSEDTAAGIDQALEWVPGSFAALRDHGTEPVRFEDSPEEYSFDLEVVLARFALVRGLTPREKRAIAGLARAGQTAAARRAQARDRRRHAS